MKKITLFFMSLFLVFGTAMAKDEVKDFNSPEVGPANGSQQTTVYNIRLKFPKHVTVTNSEVSIDVKNTNTNEVVKITSCAVDEWDPYWAVFTFEKIEVDGKDGKEYRDQYIEKPGAYTYTIPAGLIKSADGTEEFAGATYSFSIVGTFAVEDWTPKQATAVEDIVVTFDREIAEIKLPSSGLTIVDNYWSPVTTVSDAIINDDKKSVTLVLESPITAPGMYNLDFGQGVFVSEDALSEYKSISFTVFDPSPSFSTNYNDGDRVKELGNLEITFKNVTEFEMAEGAAIIAILPSEAEVEGTVEKQDNKLVVTFDEDFTEVGTYMFIIPGGAFTMDGKANEGKTISVELYSFEITPLEIVSVTPEIGEVDQIETIVITFNQLITLSQENWQQISREITLTCGDEEYILTYNPSSYNVTNKLEYTVNVEWANNAYTCTEPVTIAGEYTLNLADIVVDYAAEDGVDEWGWPAKVYHVKNHKLDGGTYTWTVSGNASAIENVPAAEGEQVIYDLLGRRVESITGAGIYIVNGKKVVIK